MKKLAIFLVIITVLATFKSSVVVRAKEENFTYARIITDDCAFYSDASLKIIKFYLPKTYAVKIVSVGTECSRVVYMDDALFCPACEGYVKNVCLSFLDETPNVISPSVKLTAETDEVIFADSALTQPKAVISAQNTGVYYGKLTVGATDYIYVYINGYIGYMRNDCFQEFDVPENIIVAPNLPDDIKPDEESTISVKEDPLKEQNFSTAETLIVAVLVIAGLSILFLVIGKNSRDKNEKTYFDED